MMTFASLINQWPSLTDLALDLGVSYETARMMRYRDSIGVAHWDTIIAAARRRGVLVNGHPVTIELLARMAADRRPKKSSALQVA